MNIPITDGTKAKRLFTTSGAEGEMAAQIAEKAMHTALEMTLLIAMNGRAPDVQSSLAAAVNEHLEAIVNTSMDAAADAFTAGRTAIASQQSPHAAATEAAIGAGVAAASAATSIGRVRHALYRGGSVLGDVEAVASGNPERMVRRAEQHVFWRAFGRVGRGLFRGIGGKR